MSGDRVAIVGSRDFPDASVVRRWVSDLSSDATVISGGARGVDVWAAEAARARGLPVLEIQAQWEALGRKAGPVRNAEIVACATRVVAFWNGRSRGTLNTVVLAAEAGLPVTILDVEGNTLPLEPVLQAARERGVHAAIEKARRPED